MAIKEYAGGAAATTITATITSGATTCNASVVTNWPTGASGRFWVKIYDPLNLATVEKILCQSRSGNVITFHTRGGDGTTPRDHAAGETIEHIWTAEDAREANDHVYDTTNDDHTQYLNAPRHDLTARHTPGSVLPVGSTTAPISGAAGSGGAASSLSLSDHSHVFPAWTSYSPTPTGITVNNGTLVGKYLVAGKLLVGLFIQFTVGSTTAFPGPLFGFGLPAGVTLTNTVFLPVVLTMGGGFGTVLGVAIGTGPPIMVMDNNAADPHNLVAYTGTVPQAFAAGDQLTIQGACLEIN